MASVTFNTGMLKLLYDASHKIDLVSDTIKIMLLTSAAIGHIDPDEANLNVSLNTYECSGTGYQAGFSGTGRKTLASKSVTVDNTNNCANFNATNPTWSAIDAGTCRYAVIYYHVTDDAHSIPLVCLDVTDPAVPTNPLTFNGGDFNLIFNPTGVPFSLGIKV